MEERDLMGQENFDVDAIFNDGERLVPFLSHDDSELVRHFSSHNFFKQIIKKDIARLNLKDINILDLGFGTGYASYAYANIEQTKAVKSIDVSEDSLSWAKDNYFNKKISYEICDAVKFLGKKDTYTYIVTRHVLEHIEDGLSIIKENKYTNRLCINVPFNEPKGNNVHHVLTGIIEKDFPAYKNVEFFYEDLNGVTYKTIPRGIHINSIIYIASKDGMPKVSDYFNFPLDAVKVEDIFFELSTNNYTFVKNLLSIQNARVQKAKELFSKNEAIRHELDTLSHEIEKLKSENSAMSKELQAIHDSKKWRLVKTLAKVKNTVSGEHGKK